MGSVLEVLRGSLIPDGDQIISKTYMTRVQGENGRLRHYLARLHRKTLCYSKSEEMLLLSIELLIYYLKNRDFSLIISKNQEFFPKISKEEINSDR